MDAAGTAVINWYPWNAGDASGSSAAVDAECEERCDHMTYASNLPRVLAYVNKPHDGHLMVVEGYRLLRFSG